MNAPHRGYAEGFYGRLLSWQERLQILDTLHKLQLNTYYYAPKEDPWHRFDWRTDYDSEWRQHFSLFTEQAAQRGIRVIAGVAPGLNFDFADLPHGHDFQILVAKCNMLLGEGASAISLLMDDIDADFHKRCGQFLSEGEAHATLANSLANSLATTNSLASMESDGESSLGLWVTPRIYADELVEDAPDYLSDFVRVLDSQHVVLYCGSDVVAREISDHSAQQLKVETNQSQKHEVVFWDNLYANDYCPRRLFIGPWSNRKNLKNVVLNPTGMVNTDCFLLELMALQLATVPKSIKPDRGAIRSESEQWLELLKQQGVPTQFAHIANYFMHPVFNAEPDVLENADYSFEALDVKAAQEAIEHCLWCWKSALAREWYPYLFGLKHDLLTRMGEHEPIRIRKTQPQPLSDLMLALSKSEK